MELRRLELFWEIDMKYKSIKIYIISELQVGKQVSTVKPCMMNS